MKIVIVGRWRPENANGVDAVIQKLIPQYRALGHDVTLWTPSPKFTSLRETSVGDGIPTVELPVLWEGLILPPKTREFVKAKSADYDVVHFHSVFTPANYSIAKFLKCPYVLSPHGGYSRFRMQYRHYWRKLAFFYFLSRPFMKNAAFLHVLSCNEEENIREICPKVKNFVIAPNGFSVEEPIIPGQQGKRRRLLFMGRLDIQIKGLDRMLNAFSKVQPCNCELAIIGPDFRNNLVSLKRQVQQSGLNEQVVFQGPIYGNKKWQELADCDAFVHFSRAEGLPMGVIEALGCGKPVLITRETNLAELVEKYDAGWIVDKNDFASTLRQFVDASDDELKRRGSNGIRLVQQELVWAKSAQMILDGYERFCCGA